MDEDFLKIGDQICLYTDSASGYLASLGFNSPEIYIQSCSKLHCSHIPNIRNMIFQITPKLSYDAEKEYRREVKSQKQKADDPAMKLEQKSPDHHQNQLKKMETLEKRRIANRENNQHLIEESFGQKVHYGMPIQLMHVDSGFFIQHAKRISQIDRSCQRIELVENPAPQRVTFYIQPRYRYREDGEPVVYNDHIILYNMKYNAYLHISEEFRFDQEIRPHQSSEYRPESPRRIQNPDEIYKRYEANISPNFYKWQVICYRQVQQPKHVSKFIFSGDVIILKHAETNGYLCYDEFSALRTGDPVYVRVYKGLDQDNILTSHNLFQIEHHNPDYIETFANQGSYLLWQNKEKGGSYTKIVRLRHLTSGLLLTVTPLKKQGETKTSKDTKYVLTLGEGIKAKEIDLRTNKIFEIEEKNKYNMDFNAKTDKEILKLNSGVKLDQVFEIENTIIEPDPKIKNLSVVKIRNLKYNLYISIQDGGADGDGEEDGGGQADASGNNLLMNQTDDIGGGGFADETITNMDNTMLDRSSMRIDGTQEVTPTGEIDASQSMLNLQGDQTLNQTAAGAKEEEADEDKEEEDFGNGKFSKIKVDETDTMSNKNTVLKRTSTMDDVYILQKFSIEKVKRILYLQSCVPKIKEFTYNLRLSPVDLKPPYIKVFEELLGRLVFFVTKSESKNPFTCEGQPVKEVQKFMRELKLIDILMDILIYPFEGPNKFEIQHLTQKSPIVAICKLIYRILKHCSKDNEENKFYVAQWISHFFDQSMITSDQNNIMADETINELLVDNKQLLQKQIGEKTIEKIVQNCSENPKNSRSIKLLASLVQCNGEAIANNQDFVCGFLLPKEDEEKDEEQKAYEDLLISVSKEKGKHLALFKDSEILEHNDGKPMKICIEDLESTFQQLFREERLYNYFVEMINLVALMCLSRNMAGIIILQDTYPIDFVLDCFLNEKIGFNLRSNFAKLLISLHIDKDPLEQINVPVLTRVWQNIIQQKSKSEIPKSLAPIDFQLLRLKQFTVTFFNDMGGVQRSWEHEQNGLTNQVLLITEAMVLLGFYTNEKELLDVLLPIIDLLDGSNDFSSREEEESFLKTNEILASGGQTEGYKSSKARYKFSEENEMIIVIKQKIIDILDKVMDIQNDIRLTKFLVEFYDTDSELLKDPMQSGPELTFLVNVEKDCIDPEEDEQIKKKSDSKVIRWMMNAYKNKNVDMKVKAKSKDKDLICILLDIILYDNAKLVNSAFTLLTRYFIQKQSLINFATEVQLLQDNQEVAILEKCEEDIRLMKKEAGEAEFWMGVPQKDCLIRARQFVDKLELLTDLCIHKPNRVIETDDKKKKNPDDDEEEEEQDLGFMNLTELTQEWDNEDPKICNDEEINDESNQRLLRNLKGYEIPILLIKNSLEEAEDKNCYLRVLEKSYIFLIKFVRNNPENQKLLVAYLDLFQDHIEYGVHAWELIGEIFKNSELLVSHPYQSLIKNVIKQIDNLPKETQKKTTMLSFLRYFMQLNGNNMKDAQNLICTEITSSSRKNCDHLFVGDVGLKDLHLYVLEMKNAYQEFMNDDRYVQEIQIPPELSYTIEYILLLGYAGEGQNAATETKAQEKLPIKDIIENMKLADFCFPLKSALTMFMNNIYFEIEKDVSDENISKMFDFLSIVKEDLGRFVEIQMRMKSSKSSNTKVKKGNAAPTEGEQEEDDLDGINVDINKNFTMLTSFGSFPILYLIEKYIYENVFVALKSYFNLRLAIKTDHEEFFTDFIQQIQKSANFAVKESHKYKCRELFKMMAKTPSLKAFGGHNMNQKQIQDRSGGDDKQRTSSNGLGTIPQLTQAQKLKAYMKSVRTSDELLVEFEKEFEELVLLIINIKQESEIAFKGINTLDVKDIINALIQISNISSSIDKSLRIVCLKVIRKVVEMENQKKNTPASEWEADDWSHVATEIKQQQAMLIKLGVVDLIADLISFETKLSIKEEALQVSVAILLGGNPESQHNFNQYIINDTTNTFMHSLKTMIQQSFEKIQTTQEKRNSSLQKKIQTENKLETITQYQGKQSKKMRDEVEKCKLEINMLNEDLKETDRDESENPAMYTTDALTVNRAIKLFNICVKLHQLFCENHNQILQNTLRQQLNDDGKSKNNSIDFPTFYAKNFETCQKIYNNITADIVNQVVETMTESIQGPCKLNQKALVQAKILDSSREYIAGFEKQNELENIGFDYEDPDDIGALGEFKQKVVGLLTSLLEGEVDHEIMQRMAFSLDFECMKDRMVKVFTQFAGEVLGYDVEMGGTGPNSIQQLSISKLDKRLNSDSFDGSLAEAVEIYILMHSLADSIQEAEKHLDRYSFTPDQWKCFEFVRSHMGRIEVCVNGNLQRIYFPIKPVCDFLSPGARKVLMTDVDRESQATKVKGLMEAVPDLIDEMTHNEELSQAWLEITPARLTALKDFSTVVGMVINILYLCFAKRKYHYKELDIDDWVLDSIQYLGYVQGASSGILIFFYAINKKRLVTQKMWRSFVAENQAEGRISLLPNNERLTVDRMSIEMTHNILMLKGPKAAEFNQDERVNFGNWFTYSEFQLFNMYFFIHDGVFRYYVLYFGISILGYISQDIYYSFHLLDVINRIPTLQNVIKSVTSNIEQLSLTLMLLMIIVYVFTSMTFFYLQDNMYDLGINAYDSDIVGENNCLTMAQCYISMLDKGLRNGGGIGDITESIHFNDQREKYFVKLFHDLSFFIVVNVIMLNVLFGIIIDTFAQLRDEKAIKDRDMMHVCFICNFPRLEFDKNGEGFEKHIEKDHNLWNYVYFILFLTSKNTSDHNGIESMIYQWYNNEEYGWIPRQKAMVLQNVAADDENDNQAQEQQRQTMLEWQNSLVVIEKEISHLLETMKKKDEAKEEALKKKNGTAGEDAPQEVAEGEPYSIEEA